MSVFIWNLTIKRRKEPAYELQSLFCPPLARYMGATPHTVRLWENGGLVPDVYQFQKIAAFFGLSYEWFLDGTAGTPDAEELAVQLGLSGETVETLMELAQTEPDEVLESLDHAVYALIGAIAAVREDVEEE